MLPPEDELPDDPADPYKAHGTILSRAELATLPKVSPLVSGVMSTPATVGLVGGYGVGKTFLALSIANAIGSPAVVMTRVEALGVTGANWKSSSPEDPASARALAIGESFR